VLVRLEEPASLRLVEVQYFTHARAKRLLHHLPGRQVLLRCFAGDRAASSTAGAARRKLSLRALHPSRSGIPLPGKRASEQHQRRRCYCQRTCHMISRSPAAPDVFGSILIMTGSGSVTGVALSWLMSFSSERNCR